MSSPNLLHRLTFGQLQVFQAVHRQRSYSRAAFSWGLPTPVAELFLSFIREHLPDYRRHFQAPSSPLPSHGVACLPILSP